MTVDYAALAPEIVISAIACIVLVLDLGLWDRMRVLSGWVSLAAVVVAFIDLMKLHGTLPRTTLSGMFVLDDFAFVFKGLFLVVAAVVIVLSMGYMRRNRYEGEYYFLLLCSVLGTMLMPSSRDLLMLFIALELVSVPAFVMAGLRKRDPRSNEACLKFFLFGVLSAGVYVYGMSLVYAFGRTTSLPKLGATLIPGQPEPLLLMGIVFMIAAFGFKVSAVPFHFWAPDTYEGSPVPLAAFLSVASKAAGFVGLALILVIGFPALASHWAPVVAVIAAFTMTVGNILALRQKHLIRLLSYSSIAQAGYMLIPIALVGASGPGPDANKEILRALVLYLIVYAVMNLGAFATAIGISKRYPSLLIRDLAGLGRRAPILAGAMGMFMLSLGGIPPVVGWVGKFFIFISAVNAGNKTGIVLASIMVVNSVISLYYYFIVVRTMFLQPATEPEPVKFSLAVNLVVGVCAAAVLIFGLFPNPFIHIASTARLVTGP